MIFTRVFEFRALSTTPALMSTMSECFLMLADGWKIELNLDLVFITQIKKL